MSGREDSEYKAYLLPLEVHLYMLSPDRVEAEKQLRESIADNLSMGKPLYSENYPYGVMPEDVNAVVKAAMKESRCGRQGVVDIEPNILGGQKDLCTCAYFFPFLLDMGEGEKSAQSLAKHKEWVHSSSRQEKVSRKITTPVNVMMLADLDDVVNLMTEQGHKGQHLIYYAGNGLFDVVSWPDIRKDRRLYIGVRSLWKEARNVVARRTAGNVAVTGPLESCQAAPLGTPRIQQVARDMVKNKIAPACAHLLLKDGQYGPWVLSQEHGRLTGQIGMALAASVGPDVGALEIVPGEIGISVCRNIQPCLMQQTV